ncbi:MAG: hypothetical protein WA347_04450 [Rhabdochlamydiaceae bacterium]
MKSFKIQFDNIISIFSLLIIFSAFVFTAWRSEISEKNQNLRVAGIEILKNLGHLQIVVNYAYFQSDNMLGNPFLGWGYIALVSDLSQLMPDPVPKTIQKLVTVWGEEANHLKTSEEAANRVSMQVDTSREEVLKLIRSLQ